VPNLNFYKWHLDNCGIVINRLLPAENHCAPAPVLWLCLLLHPSLRIRYTYILKTLSESMGTLYTRDTLEQATQPRDLLVKINEFLFKDLFFRNDQLSLI